MIKRLGLLILLIGALLFVSSPSIASGQSLDGITSADVPDALYAFLDPHYNASYEDPEARDLTGKVVFITGISGDQGAETANQFLEKGCIVIGNGANSTQPPAFLVGRVIYFQVDDTSEEAVEEMVRSIYEDHGIDHIDILIENAGRMYNGYSQDGRLYDNMRVIENNCGGTLNVYHAFDKFGMIDHFDPEGVVIAATGSIGHCSPVGHALLPYALSKSCIVELFKQLQSDAVKYGWTIRYITQSPYGVYTNIGKKQFYPASPDSDLVCAAETAIIRNNNNNSPWVDPYAAPVYSTSVTDIGKNWVMLSRYVRRVDFKLSLQSNFVIKAGRALDASGNTERDWQYYCTLWQTTNPLKVSMILKENGFAGFYPPCATVHSKHVSSATPSASPSMKKRGPKKSKNHKMVKA